MNENKKMPIIYSLYKKLNLFSFNVSKTIEEEEKELKKEILEKAKRRRFV